MWYNTGAMKNAQAQPVDSSDFPPIKGLEGPFRFPSGRILYYDAREGAYYDRKTDIYLDRAEVVQ